MESKHRNSSGVLDYTNWFPESRRVEDWVEEVKEQVSAEKLPFLALESNGRIQEGDLRRVEQDPGVRGFYLPVEFERDVPVDERDGGGFHFKNSDGSPMEVKYRFDDELREYPETIHTHNVPELYVADGRFSMALAGSVVDDTPAYFEVVDIEDEAFVVPPGMYHGIVDRSSGSNLAVVRGDPALDEEVVGKMDLEKNQLYDHFPDEKDFPEIVGYRDLDEVY